MLNKKTMLGVVAVSLSTIVAANAIAATPGVYVGGQLGAGNVHQDSSYTVTVPNKHYVSTNLKNSDSKAWGLAGRIFAGYQFDQNFGAELGYMKFSDATSKSTDTYKDNSASRKSMIALLPSTDVAIQNTTKTSAVDLVGKAIYPVGNGFNLYAKAGVAYVMQKNDFSAKSSKNVPGFKVAGGNKDENKFMPTFGVGASYDISPNAAVDVSYSRIQKVGSSSKINSTDFVGAGLTYSFG